MQYFFVRQFNAPNNLCVRCVCMPTNIKLYRIILREKLAY